MTAPRKQTGINEPKKDNNNPENKTSEEYYVVD